MLVKIMNKKQLTSRERIFTAMSLKEPDRVPIGEFAIDGKVIAGFNKGYDDVVDFAVGEGLDMVGATACFRKVRGMKGGCYIDEWGCTYAPGADVVHHPVKGAITLETDLDRYELPDPNAPHRLGGLERLVEKSAGAVAVNFHSRVAFMWSVFLMGMDNFLMAMALEPEFVHRLLGKVAEVNIAVIRRAVRVGADTISLGDDYCSNKGPLMSPVMFREFLLPHLRRASQTIHEEGAKCIKHCDGNLWPILDQLAEAGIDCINPLEPMANMDMAEVKKTYGAKLCLMGNIDCGELLCHAPEIEVERAVRECIRKGAAGGGLIVSSSNSIHSGVSPRNYAAMIRAVHKYGWYRQEKS